MMPKTQSEALIWLHTTLAPHLNEAATEFLAQAQSVDLAALGPTLARASRFARSKPLLPSPKACCQAAGSVPGWNPERLQVLEALRMALLVGRADLESEAFAKAFLGLFPYADEGELRALYKCLALLPGGERFVWQAAEGCRTNVLGVFEAVACDSPYPAAQFDEVAWRSMCIKALFMGSPLWRTYGLDQRLSPELARMALDLVEERRSAGRPIMANLWLLLGTHGGERGLASLRTEWGTLPPGQRGAVALAFARAGATDELFALPSEPADQAVLQRVREGLQDQGQWRAFEA
jgi:hypothetical protein